MANIAHNYQTGYFTDSQIVDAFKALVRAEDDDLRFNVLGANRLTDDPVVAASLGVSTDLITGAILTLKDARKAQSAVVQWQRSGSNVSVTFPKDQASINAEDAALVQDVARLLPSAFAKISLDKALSPDMRTALSGYESMVEQVRSLSIGLAKDTREWKRAQQATIDELQNRLNKEHEERSAALESRIADQEKGLERRRRELDDREAKHARRSLHKEIRRSIVETEFDAIASTKKARRSVAWTGGTAALSFAALFGVSVTTQAAGEGMELYQLLAARGFASLSFGALIVFMLRWSTSWSNQVATEDFYRQRLLLDIDRAEWTLEAAYEWYEATENVMPEAMLSALTTDLFQSHVSSHHDDTSHPAEQLADLLVRADKLQIRAGDHEMEFSGKSLRKSR
ncbi:MAG: hypothetical protein AAF447_16075 [Myxococcota bacterium]